MVAQQIRYYAHDQRVLFPGTDIIGDCEGKQLTRHGLGTLCFIKALLKFCSVSVYLLFRLLTA